MAHVLSREPGTRRPGGRYKTSCVCHAQAVATGVRPPCALSGARELCTRRSTARRSRTGPGSHAPGGQARTAVSRGVKT